MKKNTFYITTPIYYVTAKPHLGSLYSTLLADVFARWKQSNGAEVFFLTGTDEHGQKIQQAADQAGKSPKTFVDDFIPAYKQAWHTYGIDFSHFIRTTDSSHIKGAQEFIRVLLDKGDIYKDVYSGWYCTPCETFVTGKDNEGNVEQPNCVSCFRVTSRVQEETYFFRLSAYQDKLLEFYKNNPRFIIPQERANEVLSFIESGLKDLSISRTTVAWGVPFPDSPDHTVYVWVEALCNYLTAIGYGDAHRAAEFAHWWPADVQIIGKDIVRFHGVFWPALLMAAGLELPKHLLVHGWIKVDKQKMSKSLGNVIDPMVLADKYGVDAVRYYLCRQMPINQDGEFSIKDLEERITADLANDLGNLLNRILKLAQKYDIAYINAPKLWDPEALELRDASWDMLEQFTCHMNELHVHLALGVLWKFINKVNAYFHAKEPWKQAAKDRDAFNVTLSASCHGLRTIAILAWPVMPRKMTELLMALGTSYKPSEKTIEELNLNVWNHRFELVQVAPLFHKPEIVEEEKKTEELTQEEVAMSYIDINDLTKVELVVGTILSCSEVKGSSKLYCLEVDCGSYGTRQILSGVRASFTPEDLINKQATFVLNLKPRAMMGMESHGMMLVAENATGKVELMMPEKSVPNGTRLR
jgi:methionyl-tRNA synthetase